MTRRVLIAVALLAPLARAAADEDLGPTADMGAADAATDGPTADLLLPPDPDAPTVGASIDRTEAYLGDRLTLVVSAIGRSPIAATLRLPDPLDLGKFEVVQAGSEDRDLGDGKFGRRFILSIAAYEVGEHEVPGIDVRYVSAAGASRTVGTQPIAVRVRSVIGDHPSPQPQPLRPPRGITVEDQRLWLALRVGAVGLAVLLLGLTTALLVRRHRRRPRRIAVPTLVKPHVLALRRLQALRHKGVFAAGGYRPFYFEMAEIVRSFLGQRFACPALEMTTTELLATVEPHLGAYSLEVHRGLVDFLRECDRIKFAQGHADDHAAVAAVDEGETLVLAFAPGEGEETPRSGREAADA